MLKVHKPFVILRNVPITRYLIFVVDVAVRQLARDQLKQHDAECVDI